MSTKKLAVLALLGLTSAVSLQASCTQSSCDKHIAANDSGMPDSNCSGKNDCKGKGGCKTAEHDCKGKNECKGKGGCTTKTVAAVSEQMSQKRANS